MGLVPTVVATKETDLTEIAAIYAEDLPSPGTIQSELLRWTLKCKNIEYAERPTSMAKVMKMYDSDE